jgi:Kef-type K+ transport system membrane component KefB
LSFATLTVIVLVGLLGPLLSLRTSWHLPVVLGELVAGVLLGTTGLGFLDPAEPTFAFLAALGFSVVMFVVGTQVPVRAPELTSALPRGLVSAGLVGVVAAILGVVLSRLFHTDHAALYAVLMASSSAALVLPIISSLRLGGPAVLPLIPQVAVADTLCIIALPLAIDPTHAQRAGLGALSVLVAAALVYLGLAHVERSGLRRRLHRVSEKRKWALELRFSLVILFALSALAVRAHISVMLAGFACGLAVAGVGPPRRLVRQLFALSDGFLAPLFFIWLGATLDLREFTRHPGFILLGLALGLGAVLAHAALRLGGQPLPISWMAAAQLGVPVAAATTGTQLGLLEPGEPAALLLGALVTVAVAVLGGSVAARQGLVVAPLSRTADPSPG